MVVTNAVVGRTAASAALALAAMACSDTERPSTESRPTKTATRSPDTESSPTDADACMVAGPQAERKIISSFFAAYNDGAEDEAKRFAVVSGVWDPVAAPYSGVLRPDLGEWIRAGHEVQDEIEIVELCVYPGRGADGQLIRRNDVLANAGMVSLQQGFKVQVNAGVIERLVLYMPDGQAKQRFCSNFGDAMRQVQTGRNSQC